jgi:hypothetical protein
MTVTCDMDVVFLPSFLHIEKEKKGRPRIMEGPCAGKQPCPPRELNQTTVAAEENGVVLACSSQGGLEKGTILYYARFTAGRYFSL